MRQQLEERLAYGRLVRERALCLMEAHGAAATAVLHDAVAEAGLPIGERMFLEAVGARIDRLARAPQGRLGARRRLRAFRA
ncbi:hypothetical protein [Amaricoccus sp.]|uniref:hypothetical protein n=1 Tax=Amaricoccus sp. TaxID=1872485 RepID=UPI001B4FD125|nr:hypothetical protein [Amaricoccus sp.]MBP7002036.1 hypothetical protein [Amaricoccus sp.]